MHVDQTLGRARRHAIRICRIDDVVLRGSRQRPHLLLNRESRIRRCRDFGCSAENPDSARCQRRDLVSGDTQQRDGEIGCADVAVAIAGVRAGLRAGVRVGHGIGRMMGGRRRSRRGSNRIVCRWPLERTIGGRLRRLVEVRDARHLCGRCCRLRRRRGRRLLGGLLGFLLILVLRIRLRSRAEQGRVVVVQQMQIIDRSKQLLRREHPVGEIGVRTIRRDQAEGVARQDDLAAIGKQQHQIDVEHGNLDIGRREVELEMRAWRHLDDADRARRRPVYRSDDGVTGLRGVIATTFSSCDGCEGAPGLAPSDFLSTTSIGATPEQIGSTEAVTYSVHHPRALLR